jgi:hypothetical protein
MAGPGRGAGGVARRALARTGRAVARGAVRSAPVARKAARRAGRALARAGAGGGRLALAGLDRATRPLRRMWGSPEAIDSYGLVHLGSAAGDAMVAVALADSIFFSVPVGEAKVRVALYLGLTMAPLAVAAPVLVPLLDRGGHRRALSFASAAGRSALAVLAAPRVGSLLLFPLAFGVLVLSRVHTVMKNALTMAYADHRELVGTNARLGRLAVAGAVLGTGPAVLALRLGGPAAALFAAASVYALTAALNARLPEARVPSVRGRVGRLGRLPALEAAAAGVTVLRAAAGFLLFLAAFALRSGDRPTTWFGALAGAAVVGGALGDLAAPRLPREVREESVVRASLLGAGLAALVAYAAFHLPVLALFAALAGMATEFGRLAFQSLMQRSAPAGAHGRVFVRYEVAFQLAWVVGAFVPTVIPVGFRLGLLLLAVFYLGLGAGHAARPPLGRP